MPKQVVMGAVLICSFGKTPSSLIVIPKGTPTIVGGKPAATIMDYAPIVNIPTFGICTSPINPTKPTCVPVIPSPWIPGSPLFSIHNAPALNDTCKCICSWGGVIQIMQSGQTIASEQ
ncbi:MAG: DUF4280 domain-containing protein [Rivularia sp. (in: cyanobacteria)]